MQVVNFDQLRFRASEENQAVNTALATFVETAATELDELRNLVMNEGTTLKGESMLNRFLTAASSAGAERLAIVARRASIAFQEQNAGRAANLLCQAKWELESVADLANSQAVA